MTENENRIIICMIIAVLLSLIIWAIAGSIIVRENKAPSRAYMEELTHVHNTLSEMWPSSQN